MELHQVLFGSRHYEACLELRRMILRVPLGLDWSEADLEGEDQDRHLGMWEGNDLLGCVSVRPLGGEVAKLRQMAVRGDRQGTGVGRALIEETLGILRSEGLHTVELHARQSALGFYRKLGFTPVGPPFTEVGLPHRKMNRQI